MGYSITRDETHAIKDDPVKENKGTISTVVGLKYTSPRFGDLFPEARPVEYEFDGESGDMRIISDSYHTALFWESDSKWDLTGDSVSDIEPSESGPWRKFSLDILSYDERHSRTIKKVYQERLSEIDNIRSTDPEPIKQLMLCVLPYLTRIRILKEHNKRN